MSKKLLLIALLGVLFCPGQSDAQITLDKAYPSGTEGLYMVNLELSGPKYVLKSQDSGDRYLKLYNLNHSLWKSIDCNPLRAVKRTNNTTVFLFGSFYISETLFDCDTNIEFIYTSQAAGFPDRSIVDIYNEHGKMLFSSDSTDLPMNYGTGLVYLLQQRPVYNTPGGAKMILNKAVNRVGSVWNIAPHVYNLPCALSTGIAGLKKQAEGPDLSVLPNPHFYESTIKYTLPEGMERAEIVVSSMDGKELKRYQVDNTFNSIYIGHSDMPAGSYLYSLVGGGQVLTAKKVIKLN